MKVFLFLMVCMMTLDSNIEASEEKPLGLDDLRWQHRVVLVFAPGSGAAQAQDRLEQLSLQVEERDIAWFVLGDSSLDTNYPGQLEDDLRAQITDRYFTPEPAEMTIVLIGKDGGLKSRSSELNLEATFELIDQMPMRQAEMRQKGDVTD
jgi:hypothetical protein